MTDSVTLVDPSAITAQPAEDEQQSVVARVGSLPLVSSACGVVSSAYSTTKDSVPLLRGVMDAAESGVRTLGSAATTGSKPLLDRLEPQIAAVNEYAMKGLDKMEEKLPILQQPADQVVNDAVGMLRQSVAGAKGAVVGAVMGGMEMTRAAMSGGLDAVMGTRVGQMVSGGVGRALSCSEDWVEQNLPISEKELAALAEPPTADQEVALTAASSPSYFVRLGKLSAKVRARALESSLGRARRARDSTYATVAQIGSTLDLLESARTTLATANHQLGGAPEQLRQRWKEWQEAQPREKGQGAGEGEANEHTEQQLESRTLSMVRGLSSQLRSTCSGIVTSAQGLPGTVQEQLSSARLAAEELHSSLGDASSLTPKLLEQSRRHLQQVRHSMDGVMEYLLNNTPLNWLVGPFAPQVTEKKALEQPEEKKDPQNQG